MQARFDDALVSLLDAAVAGDRAAQEQLLTALFVPMCRYARRQIGNLGDADDDAKDVAQLALIRVSRRLHQCRARSDGQLLRWALSATRTVLLNQAEAWRNSPALVSLTDDDRDPDDRVRYGSWTEGREEQDGREQRGRGVLLGVLSELCRELPEDKLLLLRMKVEEEASRPQIAAALGTTSDGVKRRFKRLTETLRRGILDRVRQLAPEERSAAEQVLTKFEE